MAIRPRDESSKELLSKQLPIDDIIVARIDGNDSNSVTYRFPMGFSIIASKNGVSFAGASANFGTQQLHVIERVLRWAIKIYVELKAGRGVVPQDEIIRTISLRTKTANGFWEAWYANCRSKSETATEKDIAIRKLRDNYATWRGKI